jgi:hypothetical protein
VSLASELLCGLGGGVNDTDCVDMSLIPISRRRTAGPAGRIPMAGSRSVCLVPPGAGAMEMLARSPGAMRRLAMFGAARMPARARARAGINRPPTAL